VRLGLQIPFFTWPGGPAKLGETYGRIVQNAEAAGFYSVWVMDHFFQIQGVGPKELDMLEGYTALGYAASLTKRVKLGTMVTGITYRYPGLLIKTVTTLDVLSAGRAYFGVGAAWNEEEHNGLGVPYPPLKQRFQMLEETLQMAQQMWSENNGPFEGEHLHLGETLNVPNTLQEPHPPILIGGTGEEKTFRLIAKYGDACNIFARDPDFVRQKYAVLQQRCEEIGRPYSEIEKTTLSSILMTKDGQRPAGIQAPEWIQAMTPQQVIEHFHQLAEAGTDHGIFNAPGVEAPDFFELWTQEVIPAVEKLVPAGR